MPEKLQLLHDGELVISEQDHSKIHRSGYSYTLPLVGESNDGTLHITLRRVNDNRIAVAIETNLPDLEHAICFFALAYPDNQIAGLLTLIRIEKEDNLFEGRCVLQKNELPEKAIFGVLGIDFPISAKI